MLTIVSATEELVIALEKVKEHLRIHSSDTGQDDYDTDLIWDAVDFIENSTGFSYVDSTFDLTIPSFWTDQRFSSYPQTYPSWTGYNRIYLPRPPLVSVESITYFDTRNESQTLDSSAYNVIAVRRQLSLRVSDN